MTFLRLDQLEQLAESSNAIDEAESRSAIVKKAISYGKMYGQLLKSPGGKDLFRDDKDDEFYPEAYFEMKKALKKDKDIKFAGQGAFRGTFVFSGAVVLKLQHHLIDSSTKDELKTMKKFPELACFPKLYAGDFAKGYWMVSEACAKYDEKKAVKILAVPDKNYQAESDDGIVDVLARALYHIAENKAIKLTGYKLEDFLNHLQIDTSYDRYANVVALICKKIIAKSGTAYRVLNDLAAWNAKRSFPLEDIDKS